MCPSTAFLEMELPIDFRNVLRVEDSVIFFLCIGLWKEFLDPFGIDRSIDNDMGNMDSRGPNSRAIDWARERRPNLAPLKAAKPEAPSMDAVSPVKRIVPLPLGFM